MDFVPFNEEYVAPTSISETAGAPWMVCSAAGPSDAPTPALIQLHNEIVALCEYVSPTDRDDRVRNDLVLELKGIIQAVFPASTVHVFGSQMTRILTPNSDLDLAVMNTFIDGTEALYKLERAILDRGIASYLEVIASAKVPIIKMDHMASGIAVDILCSNEYGMAAFETGKIMKRFVSDYPALKPLTILLKIFLGQRKLNETYSGGVGSFVLCNMVISFLQMRQRLAMAEGRKEDSVSQNLGVLLIEFLNLYGNTFNYRDVGISVLEGGYYFKKISKAGNWINPARPIILAVENPESPGTDMGRNSYLIPRIKKAFEHAHRVLLYTLTNGKEVSSMLSLILNAEDPALTSITRPTTIIRHKDSKSSAEGISESASNIKKKKKKSKKKRDVSAERLCSADDGDSVTATAETTTVQAASSGRKIVAYTKEECDKEVSDPSVSSKKRRVR